MTIREEQALLQSTREDRQHLILDAIAELEQQHASGDMETPAYLIKKRALIKRL